MPAVLHHIWSSCARLGMALVCVSMVTGGCAGSLASDPAKAELLRQLRETYLFPVALSDLERLSVPEIVARLDPDTRLVAKPRMSLNVIRGFEAEASVVAVRRLGGGRGYLRLAFFSHRTLAEVRRALNGFTPPLCALTIDLRDNAGGSFEPALHLAEMFLPAGVPMALYEDRAGRALLYAAGGAAPRRERLTLLINAGTASSAELFAGVLQWHRRAELRGSPTAGKRTVQSAVRLHHDYLLFLTTGQFLAPDGSPFGVNGLTPDRPDVGDDLTGGTAPCQPGTLVPRHGCLLPVQRSG